MQDHEFQAHTIDAYAPVLADLNGRGRSFSGSCSLLFRAVHRRRRERRQRTLSHNIIVALLAILKSMNPYAESAYNRDVPWVKSMHRILLGLLRSQSGAFLFFLSHETSIQ